MTAATGENVGIGTSPTATARLRVVNDCGAYGIRGEAGNVSLTWTPMDDSGTQLPSGVYVYRLSVGDHTETRTFTVTN